MVPCDEGEHGLQYARGVKLARLGVALVGTLPQTPLRRAHLAPLREILGCRTPVLDGVKVSRHFPLCSNNLEYHMSRTRMRRHGDLHPYIGGLPATRVALTLRGNVRAEKAHKKGVAEQRNFLCEGGCLLGRILR